MRGNPMDERDACSMFPRAFALGYEAALRVARDSAPIGAGLFGDEFDPEVERVIDRVCEEAPAL